MLVLVGHPKKDSDSTSSGTLPAGPGGAGAHPGVHTRLYLFLRFPFLSYFVLPFPRTFSNFPLPFHTSSPMFSTFSTLPTFSNLLQPSQTFQNLRERSPAFYENVTKHTKVVKWSKHLVGNVHIEGLGGLQNEPGKNETLGKRSRSNSRTFKRLMRKLTNFHRFSQILDLRFL